MVPASILMMVLAFWGCLVASCMFHIFVLGRERGRGCWFKFNVTFLSYLGWKKRRQQKQRNEIENKDQVSWIEIELGAAMTYRSYASYSSECLLSALLLGSFGWCELLFLLNRKKRFIISSWRFLPSKRRPPPPILRVASSGEAQSCRERADFVATTAFRMCTMNHNITDR